MNQEQNVITNYKPYYYGCDGINDTDWGCGWRCIQMLLSQLKIEKDLFTIAFETQELIGDPFTIDIENSKIHMADTYWIMLYTCDQVQKIGFDDAKFDMLTLQNTNEIPDLYQKLQEHFLTENNLVVVTASGATSLIAGVRSADSLFEVYLVDPHVQVTGNEQQPNFDVLNGFGKGGRGWININEIILKGKNEIGIEDDNEFLENSSCLFGFFQGVYSFN
jgi:hypothetical protein